LNWSSIANNYKAPSSGTTGSTLHDYPWSESNMRFGANHPRLVLKGLIPKQNMFPDRWEPSEEHVGYTDNANQKSYL
jgi:hypothetical protein